MIFGAGAQVHGCRDILAFIRFHVHFVAVANRNPSCNQAQDNAARKECFDFGLYMLRCLVLEKLFDSLLHAMQTDDSIDLPNFLSLVELQLIQQDRLSDLPSRKRRK